jgi:itaconate CoA-transferase
VNQQSLPLAGFTVVSIEQAVAAPLATRTLADWGARVIKVERVDGGDFARHYDDHVRGMSTHFVWLNRSKESIAVDLHDPRGIEVVQRLIARADVFVQNLGPGATDRLGLSAQALRANSPGLVVVDMSGYGSAGPYRDRKAFDMLVQAESGLVSVTGTPEHGVKTGVPSADIAAGLSAAQSILTGLLHRERTGQGSSIEVSMLDALAEWMGHPMYLSAYGDREVPRTGLAHASIAPYNAFPTVDGEVLVGVQNERQWRQLALSLGRPDLLENPRFSSNIERVRHRAELESEIAAATQTVASTDLVQSLAEAGVPVAQVNSVAQVVEHPQLVSRNRWTTVGTPVGEVRALKPPAVIAGIEPRMDPVPALGEHTRSLLTEIGLSDTDATRLIADGAVA